MAYSVTQIPDGYLIEDRNYGHRLAVVRFTKQVDLTEEQETKLVNEFKDLIIERLNLKDKEELQAGTEAPCKMCGETIRYVGPYWEHLGELKPRHPAWPKE